MCQFLQEYLFFNQEDEHNVNSNIILFWKVIILLYYFNGMFNLELLLLECNTQPSHPPDKRSKDFFYLDDHGKP